jgi:hypothetical protein
MLHAQRSKDVTICIVIQGLARNLLHNKPQGFEIDVALDES